MFYLAKQKIKTYLVLLCGLIALHIIFQSSKRYTVTLGEYKITNANEEQYQSCLTSIPVIMQKMVFIKNTETIAKAEWF
jgi:hypothetical protein